jgi:hypothetical protein
MARIKIEDLSRDLEIDEKEMARVFGGYLQGDAEKGFFQGWQEKANQSDQQLTSILRIFKDLGRVGVGGSDLGAS